MTERQNTDQGENLLNLAEKSRKCDIVVKIVDRLTEGFGESIELIMKLIMSDFDVERFLEDKEYKEKFLTDLYLDKYPYLSELNFDGCELVQASLKWYGGIELPNLPTSCQSLEIEGFNLESLSGIECCTKLQSLKIQSCNFTSLSGIEGLKQLQDLDIEFCNSITTLKGIECCPRLQSITIHASNLESLSGIEKLKNLQNLKLSWINNLKSLKGIECCMNLRNVEMDPLSQNNLDPESKEILKRLEENPDVEVVYTDFTITLS